MKKILVALLSIVSTASFAQIRQGNSIVERTEVGVYGGLSVANQFVSVPGNGSYSDMNKAGGVAGISVTAPISYGWFIQPEVSYSNMGTTYYDQQVYDGNKNLNLNYLNIPVLFKYRAPFTGFGVLFGPQYSYLLGAHVAPTGSHKSEFEKASVYDDYKKSDFSGVVGLEYYFPNNGLPGPRFGLSARYQFGFINVNNGGVSDDSHITNNGFSITAGVRF